MDNNYNTKINLAQVVLGDEKEIERLLQLLSVRGWCFVEFEEEFNKKYESLFNAASSFLSGPEQHRQRFIYQRNFGYITTPAKHGFRVLTGKRLEELPIPPMIFVQLRVLAVAIDTYSKKLYEVAAPKLFAQNQTYKQEVLKKIPLMEPLVYGGPRTEYGMLDIMQYFVPSAVNGEEASNTSVAEHGDPGLFSFSFKSDQPGLSMLDPVSNTWVPVPPESSVMWCGSAAEEISKGLLKVGWHRVEKTFTKPRLTMWYEVCTYEQVPEKFLQNDIKPSAEEVVHQTVERYPVVKVKTLTGKLLEFNSVLHSNSTIEDLQVLIQDKEGIPPSKQRLMSMGRTLVSDRTFGFYGYESDQVIYLVLSLRG